MVHTSAAAQERPQPLTGGRIPENDGPSYRLWQREGGQLPVLIAVPHSGRCYPAFLLAALRQPERASLRLEDRYVDALALPAAETTQTSLLLADAPRAMIDLNRSADDIDWGMVRGPKPRMTRHSLANRRSRNGLGLVPRRLPGMGEIWRRALDRSELDSWIAGIYHPYHAALSHELERLRDRWGTALLIDLHSMPPLKSGGPGEPAAEFVVGDRFGSSCGDGLAAAALTFLSAAERRVAHNRPYSGGYVLDRHGAPRRGIHAMQLEICRSTYLDAQMREAGPRFMGVARLLGQMVRALAAQVANTSSGDTFRHAAE